MIKISLRSLFLLATLTWLFVGLFLLTTGIRLELKALHAPYFPEDPFSLLAYLMPLFHTTKENALIILMTVALFIGYCKGKFVLRKTASRQISHILSQKPPYSLATLYTKKYLILIVSMMALGMTLRHLPIHSDVRGFIDMAVGAALIQGATYYLSTIRKSTETLS